MYLARRPACHDGPCRCCEELVVPKLHPNPQQLHWTRWYSLSRWRKRRDYQLRIEPLCRVCLERGRVVAASVADHVVHHGGDWNEFRLGKLQSLCAECHAHKSSDGEVKPYQPKPSPYIDADGFPVDQNHLFNRRR
jgi:5-methylcytosine-specific restriction endonuclease McrA